MTKQAIRPDTEMGKIFFVFVVTCILLVCAINQEIAKIKTYFIFNSSFLNYKNYDPKQLSKICLLIRNLGMEGYQLNCITLYVNICSPKISQINFKFLPLSSEVLASQCILEGHSGGVVTLSPPTSEAGVRFLAWPQVRVLLVACRWSANLQYRTPTNCMYWFPLPLQLPIVI